MVSLRCCAARLEAASSNCRPVCNLLVQLASHSCSCKRLLVRTETSQAQACCSVDQLQAPCAERAHLHVGPDPADPRQIPPPGMASQVWQATGFVSVAAQSCLPPRHTTASARIDSHAGDSLAPKAASTDAGKPAMPWMLGMMSEGQLGQHRHRHACRAPAAAAAAELAGGQQLACGQRQ